MGVSGRAMLEALIAGQRDPKVLAELARGRMRGKRAALVAALTGRFDDHHAELARMLLDHIDALGIQIDRLTSRIQELIGAIPAAQPPGDGAGPSGPGTTAATTGAQDTDQPLPPTPTRPRCRRCNAWTRSPASAPRPPRYSSPNLGWTWASPHPRAAGVVGQAVPPDHPLRRHPPRRHHRQSQPLPQGRARRGRRRGRQDRHLPLGERYRRLVRRIGKLKALVAIARSILVIVWHLLADPPPASTTWAPTTTPAASTPTARPAPTSASSRPSATPSP
jgi:transposase